MLNAGGLVLAVIWVVSLLAVCRVYREYIYNTCPPRGKKNSLRKTLEIPTTDILVLVPNLYYTLAPHSDPYLIPKLGWWEVSYLGVGRGIISRSVNI